MHMDVHLKRAAAKFMRGSVNMSTLALCVVAN